MPRTLAATGQQQQQQAEAERHPGGNDDLLAFVTSLVRILDQ